MSGFRYPRVGGDGMIFREDFISSATVAGNGGVATGSPFVSQSGIVPTDTSRITYPDDSKLFCPSLTIVATCVVRAAVAAYRPILWVGGSAKRFVFGLNTGDNKLFWDDATAVRASTTEATTGLVTLALTCDGATATYYCNGASLGSGTGLFAATTGSRSIVLGNLADGSLPYGGLIKQVRVYNKILSAADILEDYRS